MTKKINAIKIYVTLVMVLILVLASIETVVAEQKYDTRISSIAPSYGYCGSTVQVSAMLEYKTLEGNWKPLAGKTVDFKLGSSQGSGMTGSNGVVTASLTVPQVANNLKAKFGGDADYDSISQEKNDFSVTGQCPDPPIPELGTSVLTVTGLIGLFCLVRLRRRD